MTKSVQFGRRSTADQVLAGIDLSGKRMVVTGCNAGLGLATMNAFAANGATVIGLARTLHAATAACAQASPLCVPIACDLAPWRVHAVRIPGSPQETQCLKASSRGLLDP